MKKRIFIAIQYLEIGGAERSLIGLLNALDYSKYEVDLFVYRHTGEFMSFIPKQVNLLPEIKKYAALNLPLVSVLKSGYWDIAFGRFQARQKAARFSRQIGNVENIAIFQYVADAKTPFLPAINPVITYDLAISFLIPPNTLRDKVKAI